MPKACVGVLALQGAFLEHEQMLQQLSVATCQVRKPLELEQCDALIIPGGESTVIGPILHGQDWQMALKAMVEAGKPLWGSCAGCILLGTDSTYALDLIDVQIERNAYGRQLASHQEAIQLSGADQTFPAIFIRAPKIKSLGPGVQALARTQEGDVVACEQGSVLVTTFHPELTDDLYFHRYFVGKIDG